MFYVLDACATRAFGVRSCIRLCVTPDAEASDVASEGPTVFGSSPSKAAPGPQPWRCLWRGFSQITITRPCRRITLHLSQIFLTLG